MIIKQNFLTVKVHIAKLLHRLGQVCLGGFGYKLNSALCVYLDINSVKVGEADKEVMLGIIIVFADRDFLNHRKQRISKAFIIGFNRLGYSIKLGIKLVAVGILCLAGKNIHTRISCRRILGCHYKVAVFKKIWSNQQSKQLTFGHSALDVFHKALARGKKLVIPDSNISTTRNVMDNSHQIVGIFPILLTIAEENIGIKCRAYSLRQLIRNKNAFKMFFQLFLVINRTCIGAEG